MADGHVAVEGHHCQEDALSGPQEQKDEEMNRAAKEAGGLWAPEVDQRLRDGTCGEAEFQEGQVREEKIHRGVEPGVPHGQQNDECVAHQSQKVGSKDNHKEHSFKSWVFREAQKEEAPRGALAGHGVFLRRSGGMRTVCSEPSSRTSPGTGQVTVGAPFSSPVPTSVFCQAHHPQRLLPFLSLLVSGLAGVGAAGHAGRWTELCAGAWG